MLRAIGYWPNEKSGMKTIHPKCLVDPSWESTRRPDIVRYLKSGTWISVQLGYSYCRFEGGPPDKEMGSRDLSDGVYVWPEGLAVYVERYHVRLPGRFIRHMARKKFSVSTGLDMDVIKRARNDQAISYIYWVIWCMNERIKWFVKSHLKLPLWRNII